MDIMQRLGGRKFLMAIASIGVATYLEMTKGLSVNMAGFLLGVVGAFSVMNYASTAKHMDTKSGGKAGPDEDLHDKIDNLSQIVNQGINPESQQVALNLFAELGKNMVELRNTTSLMGQSLVNLAQEIKRR